MNEDMKQQQLARIKNPEARALYENICAVCEKRPGGMDDIAQSIACDISMMEEQKRSFDEDVAKRGVMVPWKANQANLLVGDMNGLPQEVQDFSGLRLQQ